MRGSRFQRRLLEPGSVLRSDFTLGDRTPGHLRHADLLTRESVGPG
ncbi:hypothetical protein [Streptomyces sp. NPDC056660]